MSADLARYGGRSPFLAHWVGRALTTRVRHHFASVNWSGVAPDLSAGQGVIFYANHPSWWDPAVFALIQGSFLPDRPGFGPINSAALARYPLLRKAGFLGVDPQSTTSVIKLLKACRQIVAKGGVFWITAQGEFTDVRQRPVRLRPGIAHLAQMSDGAAIIPVALDYAYGTENRADVFIRFGRPIERTTLGPGRAAAQHMLEGALEEALNLLAADICARRREQFTLLAQGRSGMGGLYAGMQRLGSALKGKPHDARHARY